MTKAQMYTRCSQAVALMHLCDNAAWSLQNETGTINLLAESIGAATRLAAELLEPVVVGLEGDGGSE